MPKFGWGVRGVPAALATGGKYRRDDEAEDGLRDKINDYNKVYEFKFFGSRKDKTVGFTWSKLDPAAPTTTTVSGGGAPDQRYTIRTHKSAGGIDAARLNSGELARWNAEGPKPDSALQAGALEHALNNVADKLLAEDGPGLRKKTKAALDRLAALECTPLSAKDIGALEEVCRELEEIPELLAGREKAFNSGVKEQISRQAHALIGVLDDIADKLPREDGVKYREKREAALEQLRELELNPLPDHKKHVDVLIGIGRELKKIAAELPYEDIPAELKKDLTKKLEAVPAKAPEFPRAAVNLANRYNVELCKRLTERAEELKPRKDADQAGPAAAPIAASGPIKPASPAAPPTLEERLNRVGDQCAQIWGSFDEKIVEPRRALAAHAQADAHDWAKCQAQLNATKIEMQSQIDAALGEVSTLLAKAMGNPNHHDKVEALRAQRRELIRLAIEVEFPDFVGSWRSSRADDVDAIQKVIDDACEESRAVVDPAFQDNLSKIQGSLVQFKAGRSPFVVDGTIISLRELAVSVQAILSSDNIHNLPEAHQELRELQTGLAARIELEDAVSALEPHELLSPCELLRAIRSIWPLLDGDPNGAENFSATCQLVAMGYPSDLLLGYSAGLDAYLLSLKQEQAVRDAADPLKAEDVRTAVALRQELTLAYRQLDRLLKIAPGPASKEAVFRIGTNSDFIKRLHEESGGKAGREVAFLIVRISDLEAKTLKLEQSALGIHPDLDLAQFQLKDGKDAFAYAGIRDADLESLGLDPNERDEVRALIVELSLKGMGGVSDVKDATRAIKKNMSQVLRHELAQESFNRFSPKTASGLGQILLQEMLLDAKLALEPSKEKPDTKAILESRETLKPSDDDVVKMFNIVNKNIEESINSTGEEDWQTLEDESRTYRSAERALLPLLNDFNNLEQIADTHRKRLGALQRAGTIGADFDPHRPAGLASAHIILDAIALDRHLDDKGQLKSSDSEAKAQIVQTLKEVLVRLKAEETTFESPISVYFNTPERVYHSRAEKRLMRQLDVTIKLLTMTSPNDQEKAKAEAAARTVLVNARAHMLEELASLDDKTLRRPWHKKLSAALGITGPADIGMVKTLEEGAQSIVYLRVTDGRAKGKVSAHVKVLGTQMDDLLDARIKRHPDEVRAARHLIRAAILANWPIGGDDFTITDGRVLEGFDPSSKRDEITALLGVWGLDVKRFAPELDKELYGTLTKLDVRRWSAGASFGTMLPYKHKGFAEFFGLEEPYAVRYRETTTSKTLFGVDSFTAKRKVDAVTKRALMEQVRTLSENSRLIFRAGHRGTLDTGRIPLEASGANTLEVRLAGAGLGTFEIQRSQNGYHLHMRSGGEVRGNVDYRLGYRLSEVALVQAVGVGVEGSSAFTSGETVTFPNSEEGRDALMALLSKMLDGSPINVSDWSPASQVAHSTEFTGRAGASATVGLRLEAMHFLENGDQTFERLGLGLNMEAAVMGGLGTKLTDITNLNGTVHKGEFDIGGRFALTRELYARTANVFNVAGSEAAHGSGFSETAGENYNSTAFANTTLDSITLGKSVSFKRKWKQVTDDQGFYSNAVIVHQTTARADYILSYYTVINPSIVELMENNEEFKHNVHSLIKMTRPDDMISVRYELTPSAMLLANELIRQAKTLRASGLSDDKRRAKALEERAKSVAENMENYTASKIGIVLTSTDRKEVTVVDSHWLQYSVFSDGRLEHLLMTVDVPTQHVGASEQSFRGAVGRIYPELVDYTAGSFRTTFSGDPQRFLSELQAALKSDLVLEAPKFQSDFQSLISQLDQVSTEIADLTWLETDTTRKGIKDIENLVRDMLDGPVRSLKVGAFLLALQKELPQQEALLKKKEGNLAVAPIPAMA